MAIDTALANSNLTSNLTGTHYVALFNGNPTSGGTELTSGGYVRQAITFGTPANKKTSNTNKITFPIAGLDWSWTYIAIYTAATGGTLKYYDLHEGSIKANSQAIYDIGKIVVTYDNN